MDSGRTEQRAAPRFRVRIPVAARISHGADLEVFSHTENISHKGLYFYTNSDVPEGSNVEFTLTLPPEVTLSASIPVSGAGRVVRVETAPGKLGIAVQIDAYHLDA